MPLERIRPPRETIEHVMERKAVQSSYWFIMRRKDGRYMRFAVELPSGLKKMSIQDAMKHPDKEVAAAATALHLKRPHVRKAITYSLNNTRYYRPPQPPTSYKDDSFNDEDIDF